MIELSASAKDVRSDARAAQAERHLPYVPLAARAPGRAPPASTSTLRRCRRSARSCRSSRWSRRSTVRRAGRASGASCADRQACPARTSARRSSMGRPANTRGAQYLRRRGGAVSAAFVAARGHGCLARAPPSPKPDALVALEPLADELAPLRGTRALRIDPAATSFRHRDPREAAARRPSRRRSPEALLAQCRGEERWGYRASSSAASVLRQPLEPEVPLRPYSAPMQPS